MHSPFLHRNFRGPSHLVAAARKGKERQEHLYVRQQDDSKLIAVHLKGSGVRRNVSSDSPNY